MRSKFFPLIVDLNGEGFKAKMRKEELYPLQVYPFPLSFLILEWSNIFSRSRLLWNDNREDPHQMAGGLNLKLSK